ncbi:probable mediator of RNA polymerase II transcription subunit 26c [Hevea brasiliensis]|uniref:probable mediator of RNA polymerase II transcription subunit 26c n=1 Tax=Hevea brasiliensis TaxID=3981 RepID=UPI0025E8E76F|nr:probable mediator of RNA polymerase II transcription subunit 26c [Hevea brasiliensis]
MVEALELQHQKRKAAAATTVASTTEETCKFLVEFRRRYIKNIYRTDIDDLGSILESSGIDVWTFINSVILEASLYFGAELKQRREKIVEMLYASMHDVKDGDGYGSGSTSTMPRLIHGDEDEENDVLNPYARLFDDEEKKILEIKQRLEDLDQSEDSLIDLLQSLADMDITFKSLEETGIGRHVNSLRKHSYYNVRRL